MASIGIDFDIQFPAGMPKINLEHNILTAAYYGDLDNIKRAVEEYPDAVKLRDSFTGSTALHFSAGLGNYSCVEFLLGCEGIDLFEVDRNGRDALDRALLIRHSAICVLLADRMYPNRHRDDSGPIPFRRGPKPPS